MDGWVLLKGPAGQGVGYTSLSRKARATAAVRLHLSAGHFCILYPEDAHAPCVQWEEPSEVFKVVVKVAVD